LKEEMIIFGTYWLRFSLKKSYNLNKYIVLKYRNREIKKFNFSLKDFRAKFILEHGVQEVAFL
jgi:hypothetical protein